MPTWPGKSKTTQEAEIMEKKYAIVVIPNLTGEPKRFSISSKAFNSIVAACAIIVVGSLYFGYRHIKLSLEVVELDHLRTKTAQQDVQIDDFNKKIKEFDVTMQRLKTLDKKLRIITSLESGHEEDGSFNAVGGPADENPSLSDSAAEGSNDLMAKIETELDHLKKYAQLQEASLEEINIFFNKQSSLLSATPSIWPSQGWVTGGFGYRISPFTGRKEMHEGLDIAGRFGSPVLAPANGTVVRVGYDNGYGKLVEIDHGYGVVTLYGHNSDIFVSVGDTVKRGKKIAALGSTGRSTGPHIHYEVRLNGVPVNPFRYIID